MTTAKVRNMLIAKYVFLALVVINVLSSVWVILHDRAMVKKAENEFVEDWYTGEKGPGYYAKYWFIACIVIMVVNDLLSLGAIYGAYIENSQVVMVYSVLMFVMAVYGAWDQYMKGSITAYLAPLAAGILGVLYASLNHIHTYGDSQLAGEPIRFMHNTKQPTTPTAESFDESERLKMPDP